MAYADFQQTPEYISKAAGAQLEVILINAEDPSDVIIGKTTGINMNEDYETLPVEEAGEDGVDEIIDGRHAITFNLPAFWSPQNNDNLPSRQNFIGKRYIAIERYGEDWPNAGQVVQVFVGAKLSRIGHQMGARGLKTLDLAFTGTRRYTGKQWSELAAA